MWATSPHSPKDPKTSSFEHVLMNSHCCIASSRLPHVLKSKSHYSPRSSPVFLYGTLGAKQVARQMQILAETRQAADMGVSTNAGTPKWMANNLQLP